MTPQQLERYSRHTVIPEIGEEGQARIIASRVLVIGIGGLGSPAAFYLAAAGVGRLGLMDYDTVDLSNLQRQILHATPDLGRLKVESAAEKLAALNPDTDIQLHRQDITAEESASLLQEYDFVISATDNFESKYRINDACVTAGIPFSHGGINGLHGQTVTVFPRKTACFRCIFPEPPAPGVMPPASELGVLGSAAGMLGTIQATEALKFLADFGSPLTDCLLTFNAATMDFQRIKLQRQPDCPACRNDAAHANAPYR